MRTDDGSLSEGRLPRGGMLFIVSGDFSGLKFASLAGDHEVAHVVLTRSGRRVYAVRLSNAATVGAGHARKLERRDEVYVGIKRLSLFIRFSCPDYLEIAAFIAISCAIGVVLFVAGDALKKDGSPPKPTTEVECARLDEKLRSAVAALGRRDMGLARSIVEDVLQVSPKNKKAVAVREKLAKELAAQAASDAALARAATLLAKARLLSESGDSKEALKNIGAAEEEIERHAPSNAFRSELASERKRVELNYLASISLRLELVQRTLTEAGRLRRIDALNKLLPALKEVNAYSMILPRDENIVALKVNVEKAAADAAQKLLSSAIAKRRLLGCKAALPELYYIATSLAEAVPEMAANARKLSNACHS